MRARIGSDTSINRATTLSSSLARLRLSVVARLIVLEQNCITKKYCKVEDYCRIKPSCKVDSWWP